MDTEAVREQLNVLPEHRRLFRRLFELLGRGGIVEEAGDGFTVLVGPDDALPEAVPGDPEAFADRIAEVYPHGAVEVGLFRRVVNELTEVLLGRADPLTVLFGSGEPSPADLYMKAPGARSSNRMLGDAVASLLESFPDGRRLRVLEVGAGTGSATALVLPELPAGRFDYVYTDISAGFFAEAETRFGGSEASIEYRVLDIEKDPVEQGFEGHGYDLVIASNVLHATRFLEETLGHCRTLLAPSGQLLALENLRGQGWMDLTFGQLDGWWRFADPFRPHHALAGPAVWRRSLANAGFPEAEVLGLEASASAEPDRGVIVAQGPAEVVEPPGVWVLAGDRSGVAEQLAAELSARNQTVVLAGAEVEPEESGVVAISLRGAARRRAAERHRAPCRVGRARAGRHDRRVRAGREARGSERARAGTGPDRRRRGAGEGLLAAHARRTGGREGARRRDRGRNAVGLREGGGTGGGAPPAEDDRPGARSPAASVEPRQ